MGGVILTIWESVQPEKLLKSAEYDRVYLVRDRATGERRIYREFTGNGAVYRKLFQLHCPHLPRIFQIQENGERTAVLEEYIPGDTLAFLLEKGCMPEAVAAELLCQLCDALTALHQAGIVHRDVKPENIILRGSELVLIDFDVSRVTNPESDTDTRIMGTTGYAAPEQYGFSQTDARADLYACGILFNEMLTGQHPSRCLAKGPFRPVIGRCIEVNVDKRYQTAAQLRLAVVRHLSYGRHRRIYVTLALIAVITAVSLGIYTVTRPEPEQPQILLSSETVPEVPQELPTSIPSDPTEGETEPERPRFSLSSQVVPETSMGFTTPFAYDLDGDGIEENYLFGTLHRSVPPGHQHILGDTFGISGEEFCQRVVLPCVWKTEADGTLVTVPEFAEILTDPQIQVSRMEGNESPAPLIYAAEDTVWQGGVDIRFSVENLGSWYYSVSATLDGNTLTAATTTSVFDISKRF